MALRLSCGDLALRQNKRILLQQHFVGMQLSSVNTEHQRSAAPAYTGSGEACMTASVALLANQAQDEPQQGRPEVQLNDGRTQRVKPNGSRPSQWEREEVGSRVEFAAALSVRVTMTTWTQAPASS
ncbi:unnamed protein product [Lota lota]